MNNFSLRFNTYYRLGVTEYIILFVVLFVSFYLGMSTYAIENVNEGIYAEIPREMIQLSSYIIPKLNFIPYIEKPPLFYWLIALCYKIFGISEWSARIVPATAGSLVCLSLVFFGNAIRRNREGWFAAIILATSIGFIAIARVLIFDMVLTFFFTASLLSFYIWFKNQQGIYLRLFYAFLGFAFLTKGIVSLILIPSITLLFLFSMPSRYKRIKASLDIFGLLILAAIIIPWFYLAIKQQTGFAWDYFINEQVLYFLTKHVTHNYHTGPFYFYVPKVFLTLFPWSLLAVFIWKPVNSIESSLYRFFWFWFFLPFIFFSLLPVKADYFMVIGIPPLAFLLATKINELFNFKGNYSLTYFFAGLGLLMTAASGLLYAATTSLSYANYLPDAFKLDIFLAQPLFYFFISTILITSIGLIFCSYLRNSPIVAFIGVICLTLSGVIFYVADKQRVEYRHSERQIANYIFAHDSMRPVYLYQDYEQISSILFYIRKRLPLINSKSQDLYYGMQSPLAKGWFYSLNDFLAATQKEKNYVVIKKNKFIDFLHSVSPREYCMVFQSGSSVLLSNNMQECE